MNAEAHPSLLDRQVEALLAHIARYREECLGELRAKAHTEAQGLLRAARHEARTAVHNAIVEARGWLEEEARRAQARAELEAAQRAQHHTQSLLDEMWRGIGGALEVRWGDRAARRVWIEAAVHGAAALIGTQAQWHIQHGTGWTPEARAELAALATRETPALRIEWTHDERIAAGLRISAPGVCLDATVAGLLARRDQIESDFLAQYLAAASESAPQALPEHSRHE